MISADAIRGYVDIMILSILERQASYPYELVKTIARVSRGEYVIKQTTLYSAVKRLESQGLWTPAPASRNRANRAPTIGSPPPATNTSAPNARNGRRPRQSSTVS